MRAPRPGGGRGELVGVEGPVRRVQADQPRHGAGHGGAGGVGVVGRLEHDDLVAGLAQREQRRRDGLGGAHGHEDLGLGIEVEAVPGALVRGHGAPQLGDARARRVLVAPLPDGRHRHLAQLVGTVGVGEALAEVDRARGGASSDMVAKIVVVKGRRRRARYASPAATATIVPTAISGAYRLGGPCSASPTTTCTAGWTGGAGPTTTSAPSARWTPT